MKKELISINDLVRISSLQIAQETGKAHKNVMRDLREMEKDWVKTNGLKFELVKYKDKKGEIRPCYVLDRLQFLYVISKYSNEIRAKLVMRWAELEQAELNRKLSAISEAHNEVLEMVDEMRPYAEYCTDVLRSKSTYTPREIAHALGTTAQGLNRFLCDHGFQYGASGCYVPYAPYAKAQYSQTRTYLRHHSDGSVTTIHRTTWRESFIYLIRQAWEEERRLSIVVPRYTQLTFQFI